MGRFGALLARSHHDLPRRPRGRSAVTRNRLLGAAVSALEELGYAGTTTLEMQQSTT
jgi:hypothetical protein